MNEHTGTHLDAPLHCSADGRSVAEIPVRQLVRPLCIIDIRAKAGEDPDARVTPDDLRAWIGTHGPIPAGACVAMNPGWAAKVDTLAFRGAGSARPGAPAGAGLMAVRKPLTDEAAGPEARTVFDDIQRVRGTDVVNDFWRTLAHDPDLLEATWERLKVVMAPGALDPLTKELLYVAVSTANGCAYWVHSHTAAAKVKGMTPAMHGEPLAVVAMASQTNALVAARQVETDAAFEA